MNDEVRIWFGEMFVLRYFLWDNGSALGADLFLSIGLFHDSILLFPKIDRQGIIYRIKVNVQSIEQLTLNTSIARHQSL
jgi:hypothetical protein